MYQPQAYFAGYLNGLSIKLFTEKDFLEFIAKNNFHVGKAIIGGTLPRSLCPTHGQVPIYKKINGILTRIGEGHLNPDGYDEEKARSYRAMMIEEGMVNSPMFTYLP